MRLRLHRDDNPEDDAPAPIPFPRDRAPGRLDDRRRSSERPGARDAVSAADEALSDLQRGINELEDLLESLPFPKMSEQDDGPFAA
jgi:hypothetical protein